MISKMKPEQYKKSTLFRLFIYIGLSEQYICRFRRIAEDCRGVRNDANQHNQEL